MSSSIAVPREYAYVAGSVISTVWLLIYQSFVVARHRKRAGIKYPQVYAEQKEAEASRDAHLFNCAQRAHQNTLEWIPIIWATALISGINYPTLAALNLFLWTISRIQYTRGYITGDPDKRASPLYFVTVFGNLGLLVSSTWCLGNWIWQGITGA